LLAAFLFLPMFSYAETGIVTAAGTGRDSSEAIGNLLKTTVARHFREHPAAITRAVLKEEILPNASSFVQSYKITEGGKSGAVSLSANVDLDLIQGLLSLRPKNLGEQGGATALVIVQGAKIPDSVTAGMKPNASGSDPFGPLSGMARERLVRREFTEAMVGADELQSAGAGEDVASPELLRGLGSKAGARIALGISGRFESFENENSHNKEERLVLTATMVDVKAGNVLGRSTANVVNPKTRKEAYISDLQKAIVAESRDLLQDVFINAGRRLVKSEGRTEFSVVRVQYPSNSGLVSRFKTLLETIPGVRSVVEFSIRRGAYDFAVRPAMTDAALAKAITGLQSPDLQIATLQAISNEPDVHPAAVSVKLAPKEAPATESEGGAPNANH
ncbi:MAG TPA: hypothetical protein VIH99_01270, partial [Bdellovibrionota bacterium]